MRKRFTRNRLLFLPMLSASHNEIFSFQIPYLDFKCNSLPNVYLNILIRVKTFR